MTRSCRSDSCFDINAGPASVKICRTRSRKIAKLRAGLDAPCTLAKLAVVALFSGQKGGSHHSCAFQRSHRPQYPTSSDHLFTVGREPAQRRKFGVYAHLLSSRNQVTQKEKLSSVISFLSYSCRNSTFTLTCPPKLLRKKTFDDYFVI